jgi:hypothetical protein
MVYVLHDVKMYLIIGSFTLKGVCKMFGQSSSVCCPHQNNEPLISMYIQQCADRSAFDCHLWIHLKPLLYSAPNENEETLHQLIFNVCQTLHNRPRGLRKCASFHDQTCPDSRGGYSVHLL